VIVLRVLVLVLFALVFVLVLVLNTFFCRTMLLFVA
jgi:hypothetical protein